jgi:hypothetical protein
MLGVIRPGIPASSSGRDRRGRVLDPTQGGINRSDTTLTVSGKEAGLGDESQIHVVLSATELCINNGGHHPKAVNTESVNAAGDFPVQNGKADFTLSVTVVFQPECSPPMTVEFTDVTVTDTTNGLTQSFPGTF